jgi:hypothetical protein
MYLHVINMSFLGNTFGYPNGKSNSSHIRRNMSQSILFNPPVILENGLIPRLHYYNNGAMAFQQDEAQPLVRCGEYRKNKILAGTYVGQAVELISHTCSKCEVSAHIV